jgi:hypothetical protein
MGIALGEIIFILFILGAAWALFAVIYFMAKNMAKSLFVIGGKICPHCAERIQEAAKICRYCQRDVVNVEVENKPPRGLFQ